MRNEAVRADTVISGAETPPVPAGASQTKVLLCLAAIYIIWGSGYLATFVAIKSIPIFLMAGSRLTFAATPLYCALRLRRAPRPSRAEWLASAQVSLPLVVAANGACVFGQQWVDSGLTAVLVAPSPLWPVLFAGCFEVC